MARSDLDSALLLDLLAGCRQQERGCQQQLYVHYHGYALSVCLRATCTTEIRRWKP